MKNLSKYVVPLVILTITLIYACKNDEDWTPGGPFAARLFGIWKLEKVVTPTRTLLNEQIGYSEMMNITNKEGYEIEEIFKNDTLFNIQYWRRDPAPVAKTNEQTVLVTYRGGLKRFYKLHFKTGEPTILEASAYLPQPGGTSDSVKFFYKATW